MDTRVISRKSDSICYYTNGCMPGRNCSEVAHQAHRKVDKEI